MQKRKIRRNRPPQRIAVLPRIISGAKKKKKRGGVSLDHKNRRVYSALCKTINTKVDGYLPLSPSMKNTNSEKRKKKWR